MWRIVVVMVLALFPSWAGAAYFLNSAEPQCDGSDSTILMCDDYEDGTWWVTNADTDGGRDNPLNDGWAGTIFATDPLGQNGARCGNKGAVGTNCTATSSDRDSSTGNNGLRGHHTLGPTATTYYDEIYHREYFKVSANYDFGHEKWTFYERSNSSIQHGLTQTPFGNNYFDFAIQSGNDGTSGCVSKRCAQNQGNNITITPEHWYYLEVRLKLSTGEVDLWQDDCGTSGLECTGPGTLRLSHSGMVFSNAANGCCDFHQENWCPVTGSTCAGEVYRDQTVWATRRIGPMAVASSTTYGLFLSSWAGWLITLNAVLQLCMLAGYFWQQRAAIEKVAVMVWRYALLMPTPHDLYWTIKYRKAVKQWQQQAPKMLPPSGHILDVPFTVKQERER